MSVRTETKDGVVTATIDRGDAMNAIDEEVLGGLAQTVSGVAGDSSVRALVITGVGDTFCAGLDIGLLGRAFADDAYFVDVLERFNRVLLDLEALPVVVIAAVNGLARAGGFELMLACDIALIVEGARIADHHLASGILPGGGATHRLPRQVGWQRAREIILTARWLSASEAVSYGLALRVVAREALASEVESLVAPLRQRSRAAIGAAKAAMNACDGVPTDQASEIELTHFMRYLRDEPHAREGYQSFVENRAPRWP